MSTLVTLIHFGSFQMLLLIVDRFLFIYFFYSLPFPPTAMATESGPYEPGGAATALRSLHRAGHHVSAGDCGLC